MNWKELIREKMEHQVDGLIRETEARIEAAAHRWAVDVSEIAVTVGEADPCVQVNLRVQKKYKQ